MGYFDSALALSNYDMTQFDGNVTDLATRLIGFNGCTPPQVEEIFSRWQQSWKIMNLLYSQAHSILGSNGFNFNEASAVDYLGPLQRMLIIKALISECTFD